MVKGRVSHPAFVVPAGQCAYVTCGGLRIQPSGPPAGPRRIRQIMQQIDYANVNVSSLSCVLFKQNHTSKRAVVILLNKQGVDTQYLTF